MHRIESPRADDSAIEMEIQAKGLTAPRVTPAQIENLIASEHYFTATDGLNGANIEVLGGGTLCVNTHRSPFELSLLTFCVLVLRNGFMVTGESACVSPESFDAELGRKIARENAKQKIWPLEGYLLKQMLHDARINGADRV